MKKKKVEHGPNRIARKALPSITICEKRSQGYLMNKKGSFRLVTSAVCPLGFYSQAVDVNKASPAENRVSYCVMEYSRNL